MVESTGLQGAACSREVENRHAGVPIRAQTARDDADVVLSVQEEPHHVEAMGVVLDVQDVPVCKLLGKPVGDEPQVDSGSVRLVGDDQIPLSLSQTQAPVAAEAVVADEGESAVLSALAPVAND